MTKNPKLSKTQTQERNVINDGQPITKTHMYSKLYLQNIINNHDLENFSCLSKKRCRYSELDMKHYREKLLQSSIGSQYQLEGFTEAPRVSTTKLQFPPKTSRQLETLFLSLFCSNNIMNEFLHRQGEQNSFYLLIFCHNIHPNTKKSMSELLEIHPFHNVSNHGYGGNSTLVSWSRLPEFFHLAVEIVKDAEDFFRTEVNL